MAETNPNKIRLVMLLAAISLVFTLTGVHAFTANGTGKIFDFAITSGNDNISGSSYKTYPVIGDIISTVNSLNFKTELGFLRSLPYLNGESCQTALECIGGYCCSSVCRSSARPTEEATGGGAAASAAAAGGGEGFVEDFSIDTTLIKALIRQGGTYQTKFVIKNTGTKELDFDVDYSALEELVLLSDTQFALAPDESKAINVTIFASEEQKPDVYTGNIRIKAGNIEKALPVIIAVQAKKALFDIIVEVLPQSKYVLKTENVAANITLINVGDLKPVDARLYYAIRDIEGKDLVFSTETIAVYDKVSKIKEMELPKDMQLGTYIFYVRVSYITDTAAAGDIFYVVSVKPTCFDSIKNQNEEGIDCGGICQPCEKKLAGFFTAILSFIAKHIIYVIIAMLLGMIILLLYLLLKRKERKKEEKKAVKTEEVEEAEKPKELGIMRIFRPKKYEKYGRLADELKYAIKVHDISKAANLYIKARDAYTGLPEEEKQELYPDLLLLYNQIAQAEASKALTMEKWGKRKAGQGKKTKIRHDIGKASRQPKKRKQLRQ